MTVTPGSELLHYRFVEQIGAGGMGLVWKAVDTRLERDIAIKLLPEEVSRDPQRLARFQREARVLAQITTGPGGKRSLSGAVLVQGRGRRRAGVQIPVP